MAVSAMANELPGIPILIPSVSYPAWGRGEEGRVREVTLFVNVGELATRYWGST